MAQKDLIPMNTRSKEEAKRMAANGGYKSGITRRKKRDMREAAKLVLQLVPEITPEMIDGILAPSGVDMDKTRLDTGMISLLAVAQKAMRGDIASLELLRDTAGEKPTDKVDFTSAETRVELVIRGDDENT